MSGVESMHVRIHLLLHFCYSQLVLCSTGPFTASQIIHPGLIYDVRLRFCTYAEAASPLMMAPKMQEVNVSIWDLLRVNVFTPRCLLSVSHWTEDEAEGVNKVFMLLFICSRVLSDPG
jgi:hypothetical protein